ncbi:MAG TPA: alpha-amylase [Flavobacteriales bacterium]|nr:alpha-amylase [Flavobacteriales bacterium]
MKKVILFGSTICVVLLGFSVVSCGDVVSASTPSEVVGEGEVEDELKHAVWSKNATIYEVNLRQHTAEGTLMAFKNDLPRIKELGVDVLWLMPIHPIGEVNRKGGENNANFIAEPGSGSLGSPYSVKNYVEVNPDYGTMEDFVSVVDEAHNLGMKVILDWVANHSAFDCDWTAHHRGYYLLDNTGNLQPPTGTNWWDVSQFDWEHGVQNGLYDGMAKAMEFWVSEAAVDGFRCDVAEKVPVEFWEMARRRLEAINPEVFMLAEADVAEHHDRAFDMSCAWHYHHLTNEIAKGREDATVLVEYLNGEAEKFPTDAYRMGFVTNHDENSWNGTISERYRDAGDALVVLSGTLFDMPLIYSGQESGMDKRLRFFEKDTIEWGDYSKADFYRSINTLHHDEEAMWNGDFGGTPVVLRNDSPKSIFAFSKKKGESEVVVILNLSAEEVPLSVEMPEGEFQTVMSSGVNLNDSGEDMLNPWAYTVLSKLHE